MKDYLTQAIRSLKPNSEFVYTDSDYSTINWIVLDGDAPTQAEVNAAIEEVKADEEANAQAKATQRQAILDRLGITAEEAQLLLS
jgi:acyl-CoA reductase-like NAD-dependent aldehyde dehydrogenase